MTSPDSRDKASPSRIGVARVLMALIAVSALAAGTAVIVDLIAADAATTVAESWRGIGLVTFAGLFGLLAWRPTAYPGLWELAIANKVALTVAGIALGAADGAREMAVADGVLVGLLLIAYLLAGGPRLWRR